MAFKDDFETFKKNFEQTGKEFDEIFDKDFTKRFVKEFSAIEDDINKAGEAMSSAIDKI